MNRNRSRKAHAVAALLSVGLLLLGFGLSNLEAKRQFEIDVDGTLRLLERQKSGELLPVEHPPNVRYKIFFQYEDPQLSGSKWDRRSRVDRDGSFTIPDLLSDKIYRVYVQREALSEVGVEEEDLLIDLPGQFFEEYEVAPDTDAEKQITLRMPDMTVRTMDTFVEERQIITFRYVSDRNSLQVSKITTIEPAVAGVASLP